MLVSWTNCCQSSNQSTIFSSTSCTFWLFFHDGKCGWWASWQPLPVVAGSDALGTKASSFHGFDSSVNCPSLTERHLKDNNLWVQSQKRWKYTAATKCSCFCFKVPRSSEGIDEAWIFNSSAVAQDTNDSACLKAMTISMDFIFVPWLELEEWLVKARLEGVLVQSEEACSTSFLCASPKNAVCGDHCDTTFCFFCWTLDTEFWNM